MEDMRKIRVTVELEHREFIAEVEDDVSAKHISELAWIGAINVLNVSWREEK